MAVKKSRKTPVRRRARTIQKNIGKGQNININIDQSKRTTKKGTTQPAPQRQPQVISTFTPTQAPPPIFNISPPSSNAFDTAVRDTQRGKVHEPNELEKPKPKEKEPENEEVVELAPVEPMQRRAPKSNIVEIANTQRERTVLEGRYNEPMTITLMNQRRDQEEAEPEVPIIPFEGEGQQLDPETADYPKLSNKALALYRQEIFSSQVKPQINPTPTKPQIQPTPKKPQIQPQQEISPEIIEKSKYADYINGLGKEELRAEAEKKGVDVKGKKKQQVRDILLGKKENFKLEPLPEEKQVANIEEEKQKRIAKIQGMSWNNLKREASRRGVKYPQTGTDKEKLKQILIESEN